MKNENIEKPSFLKRTLAFLVDIILVILLSTLISMILFNNSEKQEIADQITKITNLTSKYDANKITEEDFNNQLDELSEMINKENTDISVKNAIKFTKSYATGEITKEEYDKELETLVNKLKDEGVTLSSTQLLMLMSRYSDGEITRDEFYEEYGILNYYVTKETAPTSIAYCAVALVYYVILCYYCHGITLGKYLMKLRIVSANGKKLNMGNYLLRSLFMNLILSYAISVIFVFTMDVNTFTAVSSKVSTILTLFVLVSIIFAMYRNDGRGLHDLMSNTKVVKANVKVNEEIKEAKKDEVVEASVVEEKEVVKKNTEKNNKIKTEKKTSTKKSTKKSGGKK